MRLRVSLFFFVCILFLTFSADTSAQTIPTCGPYDAVVNGTTINFTSYNCGQLFLEGDYYFVEVYRGSTHMISIDLRKQTPINRTYVGSTNISNPGGYLAVFKSGVIRYDVNSWGYTTVTREGPYKLYEIPFVIEAREDNVANDYSTAPGPDPRIVLCPGGGNCIRTGIGDIRFDNNIAFAARLANIGVALGGSVALILIVISAYRIMTSQGDPRRLAGAKELLAGAVFGIIMLVFSGFILRFIGVKILGLF